MTLTIDGVVLDYAWFGGDPDIAESAALTIVLLHEGLGSVGLWRDFPDRLAAATGLRVFAYSRAGYGRSDPVPLPRPLDYMEREAALLPRVLQAAGIARCVLLGHSDGASIATLHAGGTQDFRVLGLILIAPHFFVEDIGIAAIEAARAAYESGDLRGRLAKHHADVDVAFRGWNDAWLDPGFRDWRIDDRIAFIRVPVLMIQGTDDEYGTPAQLEQAQAEAYCPVEVMLVQGARHSPHMTHADIVLPAIVAFCGRVRGMVDLEPSETMTQPQGPCIIMQISA